tara:strand:+ start:1633 stop:1812 length:180 start_codon:yes stop_codon:yes gene_type:complete
MEKALNFAKDFIKYHPEHTEEIKNLYCLMMSEIEQGESENNEKELFISSCKQLLNQDKL